jgi:2-methylcitrate dehydratase PrpD
MERMNKTITTICNKSTTSAVQIQNPIGHRRNRGKKTNKKQQQQTNKQTNKTHTHRPTSPDRQLSWLADTLR